MTESTDTATRTAPAGAARPAPSTTAADPRPRTGLVLAAACMSQLLVALDISVVNVALPAIGGSLGFTAASLSWVVNGYTLAFGGLLLLGGRVADLLGHRRTMLAALALFGAVSVLGGLAQDPGQLIGARAAQGAAAAVLAPVSLTVLMVSFPEGPRRRRALAAWGAVATGGGALGVLLSGVLTQYLGWRWVLFVNAPLVLVAAALALAGVRDRRGREPMALDVLGALLATAATTLLVYGCVRAAEYDWSDPVTIAALAGAAVTGAGFVLRERRAETPLVRLPVLRPRSVWVATVILAAIGGATIAGFYFGSLALQRVLGYDPVTTGLALLPFFVGMAAATTASSRLVERLGTRAVLTLGLAIGAMGMIGFARLEPGSGYSTFLLATIPASIGLGLCIAPTLALGTTGADPGDAGMVSGVLNTSRQVGGSIALAVLSTLAATAGGQAAPDASAAGYQAAFVATGVLLFAGAAVALAGVPGRAGLGPRG